MICTSCDLLHEERHDEYNARWKQGLPLLHRRDRGRILPGSGVSNRRQSGCLHAVWTDYWKQETLQRFVYLENIEIKYYLFITFFTF